MMNSVGSVNNNSPNIGAHNQQLTPVAYSRPVVGVVEPPEKLPKVKAFDFDKANERRKAMLLEIEQNKPSRHKYSNKKRKTPVAIKIIIGTILAALLLKFSGLGSKILKLFNKVKH